MNFLVDVITVILGLLGAVFFYLIEIFILPGFGVMGVIGTVLIFLSVFHAYKTLGTEAAFYTLFVGLFISGLFIYYFIRRKLFKRSTLQYRLSKEDGFAVRHFLIEEYMNREGQAVTNLRPIGIIQIDEERLDAVAEGGGFIEKGSRVKVVDIEGNKLVVQKFEEV
jgi:membrane-bound serine protease (ClpP class)